MPTSLLLETLSEKWNELKEQREAKRVVYLLTFVELNYFDETLVLEGVLGGQKALVGTW